MKRPSKKRVIQVMRREMSTMGFGGFKILDAVELTSGAMVLEYEFRSRVPGKHDDLGILVALYVKTVNPTNQPVSTMIVKSWFEGD